MKRVFIFLSAYLAFLPLMGFDMANNKKAECVIAVAGDPAEFERKATDELKYFLEKITGAEFKVVPESEVKNNPAIYLGQTKFAASNDVDFSKADKEEWILKTVGNNLIISGGRPVGTLYGVYSLLEKLGVYFLALDSTVIPVKDKLSVPALNEKNKPAFRGRNIFDNFSWPGVYTKIPAKIHQAYWLYRLRNRLNGGDGIERAKNWREIPAPLYLGDMFNIKRQPYHTFSYYVNPKLFAKHPEYFSMNREGKRVKPKSFFAQGSLCLTNKDVWHVTLESLRKYIKRDRASLPKDKWPVVYDISTLDNTPYICCCPKCSEVAKSEGGDCGLVLRYINYIATEIAKEYPEIKIRTFAYSSAKKVPQITRPVSNVLIQYCDDFPRSDCYRPLTSKFNTELLKELKSWTDTGANVVLWDYWNIGDRYFNPPRIETVIDAFQSDMKTFRKLGIKGIFNESSISTATPQNFYELHFFVASHLMVNPDMDVEKLIDVFMDGFYGPAAPEMKKYLQIIRNGMQSHPKRQRTMRVARWKFITLEFLLDSYKMLKNAEKKTAPGSAYRQRLHKEMLPLLWQIIASWSENKTGIEKAGYTKLELEKEFKDYSVEYINRLAPKDTSRPMKEFQDKYETLTARIPCPEPFRNVEEGNIRVYGYPQFRQVKEVYGIIVDDPDSQTGKALQSAHPDAGHHGVKAIIRDKNGAKEYAFRATAFAVSRLDTESLEEKGMTIEEIPLDEKYHWYKIPKAEISSNCLLWGHCWAIQFDLSQAYQLADGVSDNNIWDVWFSAKFTGPEWVKGSIKKNAVYLDQVVLVRPTAGR